MIGSIRRNIAHQLALIAKWMSPPCASPVPAELPAEHEIVARRLAVWNYPIALNREQCAALNRFKRSIVTKN